MLYNSIKAKQPEKIMNVREYYARLTLDKASYSWLELTEFKTMTAAQSYVERNWNSVSEIGASINGAKIKVLSKKTADGKWELIYG